MNKTKFSLISALFALLVVFSFSSCDNEKDNPKDGEGVIGDWITPAGADYCNIVFSAQYTYTITTVQNGNSVEEGTYSVDINAKEITLKPSLDGATNRKWNYVYINKDELKITGKILANDQESKTLTLSKK